MLIVNDLVNWAGVASVHWAVKLNVPVAVGVPPIVPVAGSSDRPVGSAPEVTVQPDVGVCVP